MRKSEAAKYARWSAAAALLLAGLTFAVYLKRGWTRYLEIKRAPAAAPVNVERQSSGLTLSKVEGNHTIFTIEASKSIDFKGLNASDLEGVKITIFGKEGARHDILETHSCRYTKNSGDIVCSGDVQIVMMSAEEWNMSGGRTGSPGAMKIETTDVAFNRASGEARTDSEVRFTFASGGGHALGADYRSDEGTLRLQHDVALKLEPPPSPRAESKATNQKRQAVEVRGTSMDLSRDAGTVVLSGPAEAKTDTQRLTAAGMVLELDKNFHAKRLVAKAGGQGTRPQFSAEKGTGKQRLVADEIAANFAPEGWVTRADANGNVDAESSGGNQSQYAKANSAVLEMAAGLNLPKQLTLKGAVDASMAGAMKGPRGTDSRRITTEELQLDFEAQKNGGARLSAAHTPVPGRIEWNESASGTAKSSQTIVQANTLALKFDPGGKPSRLDANGNARTERSMSGADKQTATAKNGFVELQPQGGWSRMELNDGVKLNEGVRSAQADRAVFVRAEQMVTLTGRATAQDATTITSAPRLTFWQASGDARGDGGVRSTDLPARPGAVQPPAASNITADQMSGNAKTGRALYAGHARMWQGDSVLEANSIELFKTERRLYASGNVRSVFPQARGMSNTAPAGSSSGAQKTALWHVQAANMTYWDQENRAHLEQNVVVQAPDQKITANDMDLYFSRTAGKPVASAAGGAVGGQQINRAVANGNVTVQQGERRATAEHGEYTAGDGKFIMTGGTPTLFDAAEGTTTGRQLTFFLADATIIVDSENGSRTLTKHRVEKQ